LLEGLYERRILKLLARESLLLPSNLTGEEREWAIDPIPVPREVIVQPQNKSKKVGKEISQEEELGVGILAVKDPLKDSRFYPKEKTETVLVIVLIQERPDGIKQLPGRVNHVQV
jgi:hypothetical protein